MAKRVGLGRIEKLMEQLDRNIDLEGSDVVVNKLTSDTGITATAGGITATAGGITATAGGITATAGGITATAGGLTVTAGQTVLRGTSAVVRYQGDPQTIADDNTALTLANVSAQIIQCTPTVNRTKDTPNAQDLVDALGLDEADDAADFSLINLAAAGSGLTVTLTSPAASVILVGNFEVAAASTGLFRARRQVEQATIYRIG